MGWVRKYQSKPTTAGALVTLPILPGIPTIFYKYLFHKYIRRVTNPKYYPYHYDGLATRHNCSFMKNEIFVKSHARAIKAANNIFGKDYNPL